MHYFLFLLYWHTHLSISSQSDRIPSRTLSESEKHLTIQRPLELTQNNNFFLKVIVRGGHYLNNYTYS